MRRAVAKSIARPPPSSTQRAPFCAGSYEAQPLQNASGREAFRLEETWCAACLLSFTYRCNTRSVWSRIDQFAWQQPPRNRRSARFSECERRRPACYCHSKRSVDGVRTGDDPKFLRHSCRKNPFSAAAAGADFVRAIEPVDLLRATPAPALSTVRLDAASFCYLGNSCMIAKERTC
jgi:hypothetical protein